MIHSRSAARWIGAIQLLALLPSVVCGSVCFREGAGASLGIVPCACARALPDGAETAFQASEPPECGPCQDVGISALAAARHDGAPECLVPDPSSSYPDAPPEPSDRRLPSLRSPHEPSERDSLILRC